MRYGQFIDAEGSLSINLRFLSKALSDDDTRYFLKYIRIEPSDKGEGLLAVATDGRRLHLVDPICERTIAEELVGLAPGFWQVLKNSGQKKTWIARLDDSETSKNTFPNWRKIMPSVKPEYETTFDGFSSTSREQVNHTGLVTLLREFPEATAIDLGFLESLGTAFTWKVDWYGPDKAMKFTNGNRIALIMPMNFF